MSIQLIAIDIDGTLTQSTGPKISPRNCAALQAAEAAGIEIVIATGRRQAYAMPLIQQAGIRENSVMISSNGAVVRTFDGDLLDRRFLPVETARELCAFLRGYGSMVFTFDREGPGCLVVESFRQLHSRIDRWVEANRPYLMEIEPIERAFDTGEEPIQGMVCGTLEEMAEAEKQLLGSDVAGRVAMHRTEYAARNLSILDLLPPGCSKGAALDSLARIRGLMPDQIMAIGDNLNDLEMLTYAGRSVVMGNASPEILSLARQRRWEITASNDEDGVALAIEKVLSSVTDEVEGNGAEANAGKPMVQFAQ
ncbi:MAG TPA: Cof-type HAD-IIB family hydrolase [Acidobacteriaceae bacterium]|nr:Cof-type HAD-IIB family hydrolase [Acidobacteriaceae bacterium]